MAVISRDAIAPAATRTADLARLLASPWVLAVILLAAFAAYAPTLNDWFTSDDFWFLRAGQTSSFGDYALKVFDFRETGSQPELNRYRPLYPLAWWLQYQAFGLHALPYHAVIVALHLVCVVLAWWIFRRLLGTGALANFATLLFALHPAFAEAIAWISGGNRVFAAAPALGSLLLFMKAHDERSRRGLLIAGSFLLYVVAILMHSSTVTMAAVLAAYSFFVATRPTDALRVRAWLPIVPYVAAAAGLYLIQHWVRGHLEAEQGFSFGWHMYSNYAVYLAMVVLPVSSLSGDAPALIENMKLLAALGVLATAVTIAYRRPFWGVGVFALAWLGLSLLPDSTFIIAGASRVMYLAAVPAALILVLAVVYVRDLLPVDIARRATAAAPYAAILLLIPLAAASYGRTRGTRDYADSYHSFANAMRADVASVPPGGTLYISGAPMPPFSPPSHVQSLAQMYYGDVPVVLLAPGEQPPTLGTADQLFAYNP